jgi:hypothetical protein
MFRPSERKEWIVLGDFWGASAAPFDRLAAIIFSKRHPAETTLMCIVLRAFRSATSFVDDYRKLGLSIQVLLPVVGIVANGLCVSACDNGQAEPSLKAAATRPALQAELIVRARKDQDIRSQVVESLREKGATFGSKDVEALTGPVIVEMQRIDAENRTWLKDVVNRYGWPGKSLVDSDGAQSAFLIVQHANHDLPFQKHCLTLMQQAPTGDVAPDQIAYLMDRTRLVDGQKQVYGTQVELKDGRWIVSSVENPEELDRRRKEFGLPPIEDYLKLVRTMYSAPADDQPKRNRAHGRCPTH